jgi:hypothetical protein
LRCGSATTIAPPSAEVNSLVAWKLSVVASPNCAIGLPSIAVPNACAPS